MCMMIFLNGYIYYTYFKFIHTMTVMIS